MTSSLMYGRSDGHGTKSEVTRDETRSETRSSTLGFFLFCGEGKDFPNDRSPILSVYSSEKVILQRTPNNFHSVSTQLDSIYSFFGRVVGRWEGSGSVNIGVETPSVSLNQLGQRLGERE